MPEPTNKRPRRCVVCTHPDRQAIDQALINGQSFRKVAGTFGIRSHNTVRDHHDKCLGDAYALAVSKITGENALAIAGRLRYLDEVVDEVIERNREGKVRLDENGLPILGHDGHQVVDYDDRAILSAVREGRANLETLGRFSNGQEPDPDTAALDVAKAGLGNPKVRALLAQAEAELAKVMAEGGG
jgi:hypothetical protein